MSIFASLFFFFFSFMVFGDCNFRKEVKKVISLSGSMTVLLENIGLTNNSKLAGVSVFNPIDEKKYTGKIYPGGLFLAHTTLEEFGGAVVFFDQGIQIKKILSSRQDVIAKEIVTRELLPLEVVDLTIKELSSFVSGCDGELKTFRKNAEKLQDDLLKIFVSKLNVIFFLGPDRGSRLPELVIANDGVPKLLLKKGKISSYPSELSYVNWSARVMASMPKDTLHVIVEDPGMKNVKKIRRSSNRMTFTYPGSLVPGFSQLEAFLFWSRSL